MTSIAILFVLCITIVLSIANSGSAQRKIECNADKMDETTRWLFFFGDPKRKIPETEAERSQFCSDKIQKELYVKDYAKKCLKAFPYQVTTLLMYGVIRKNKYYCTFKRGKKDIVAMAKCLNAVKAKGNTCMNKLIEEAMVSIDAPESLKIGLICCNYYKFEECVSQEASDTQNPNCNHDSIVLIDQLLEGYTGQMIGHICTQFKRETDQCSKILKQSKSYLKNSTTQTRFKSILPPFINILESIPA